MDHLEGASSDRGDRVDFDRRVRLEFRGAQISSDGGMLVMRDKRAGKNTVHRLDGLFRQSVFGHLAGYEDANDADRLVLDPVLRQDRSARCAEKHPPVQAACSATDATWRKKLVQREKSGDLLVRRQATWRMSTEDLICIEKGNKKCLLVPKHSPV